MSKKRVELSFLSETDYRLWVLLAQARDAVLKARTIELKGYGISAIEALALFALNDLGDMATAAELSRRMLRGHNTVSALLLRMQKKGWVERFRDCERKNIWRVALTEQGKDACGHAMQIDSLHSAFSSLSNGQKEKLESQLTSVRQTSLNWSAREAAPMLP
jgi:DNA-binding MarR family transcriptional regulator